MFTRIASASILLALPLVAFAVPIDGTDQARDDAAIVPTLGLPVVGPLLGDVTGLLGSVLNGLPLGNVLLETPTHLLSLPVPLPTGIIPALPLAEADKEGSSSSN
ncbi:hypothetical protein NLI96_g4956 [Meripilus lineatus]|uniref:Secreted protein n=1 Tax=Meripilus lineatus TaxID=2056292 RepID=A0AAD5V3M9_9APHY|nr:hypothetical protein NLI96_g4956 [Physisporinus lineatus]